MKWGAYVRLMRMDKPIGIVLLWIPAALALWVANQGNPPIELVFYFFMGTVAMRAAGCVVNDMADRHYDCHVKRTSKRPLTSGEVGLPEALMLFLMLLGVAYSIISQLPIKCFYFALIGLFITVLYPFCKRWFHIPQFVLSLAFSVSIPMVYVASGVSFNLDMLLLLLMNMLWVISYDTVYAMVDRDDDLTLGLQSSAVLFGSYERSIIGLMQLIMHALWIPLFFQTQVSSFFLYGWLIGFGIIVYQQYLIKDQNPLNCFKAFQWSGMYGVIMWLSVLRPINGFLLN